MPKTSPAVQANLEAAPASHPAALSVNAIAARRNPIIGEDRNATLFNAGCVAEFLAATHRDAADYAFEHDGESTTYCANELRGMSLVCDGLAAAIWFELEGRQ